MSRLFPLLPMTWHLLRDQRIPLSPSVLRALLHVNLRMHVLYARMHHPRYDRMFVRHLERQLWRLGSAG